MTDREPIWRRYRDFLRRRSNEDVDDEVRLHLEMRREEALRAGLDPERANAVVHERFGDVDGVVAELRAIDGARERRRVRADWVSDLSQDVRFALRSLRRSPAFAFAAVTTLAIAIAANTTIFSFVNAMLVEPLPYRRPNELVFVNANIIGSTGELLALRERSTVFSDLGLFRARSVTLSDDRDATRLDGLAVTPDLLRTLGVSPLVGTLFGDETTAQGAGNVILLSHGFWMERYGGDRNVIGRRVFVDGSSYSIIGVMPPEFRVSGGLSRTLMRSGGPAFWVPVTINPGNITATWAVGGAGFIGRLAPGVTPARASAQLTSVLPGMRRLNPRWDPGDQYGTPAVAQPLRDAIVTQERPVLLLLMGCVVVVLLVACVNVANLTLARVTARERELGVRAALGGGRGRLIRQMLTESGVTAIIGAVVGTLLSLAAVRWGVASLPAGVGRLVDVRVNGTVLAFTAGVAILTGLAFGLLPAVRAASMGGSAGAAHFGRGSVGGRVHQRLSSALVAGEIALAVLLAITAGLLTRSFDRLRNLSPGFHTEHVMTARISPPRARYTDAPHTSAFYDELATRLSATPGVSAVGFVDRLPIAAPVFGMGLKVEGQFEDDTQLLPAANHVQLATPGYLTAIGLPIVRGRSIEQFDRDGTQPVALVSQSLAQRFWPQGDAIGKRIAYPGPNPWLTIVGVVADVKLDSLRDTARSAILVPFAQRPPFAQAEMSVVIRSSADPSLIARQLRDVVASIDRTVPVTSIRTMDEVVAGSVERSRFTTVLVGGFALAALLLGATGIYGVMSYVVSQRSHEMGVRAALGATSRDIFRLVVGRAARLAIVGAATGCVLALAVGQSVRSMLYGVSATDPVTFAVAVFLFVGVAIAASVGPAWRATHSDPVRALRDA